MLLNTLVSLSLLSFVMAGPTAHAVTEGRNFLMCFSTQVKVLTDVAPFIVTSTTVFTFTPSATTSIANPTGTGV
ncbi:hypothetical protein B0H14DRAFT_2694464 [Mycena olivaceomarginata]|nr:hypothetical protein B0H14DRAFT_2694464 [Mycena olivaceomarginata]